MASSKLKIVAVGTGVGILVIGAAVLGVKTVHGVQAANEPDIQGAWTGDFEFKELKMPLMFKISRVNGSYHAEEVNAYQGAREIPVSRLVYDYPSVRVEVQAVGFTYEAKLNKDTMEMSGTWQQGSSSGPFVMKRNANLAAFPEPMAESDYAPRKDSDLQGYWQGTLNPGNTPLRVALKIAERADGTFRVAGDNPDQGAKDIEATAVTYHRPTVRVEFGGLGGYYEGTVDDSDRVITGNWIQGGKPLPLTLERAKPETWEAQEAEKDYSYTGPNDLPGHWKGILSADRNGNKVKLHLAVDIARMPDGSFSSSLDSPDALSKGVVATSVQFSPPHVRVEWRGIGARFEGRLNNGKLTGTWYGGGQGPPGSSSPMVFERSGSK
jgi:hypothetical protein